MTEEPKTTDEAAEEAVETPTEDEAVETKPQSALEAVEDLKDTVKTAKNEIVNAGLDPLKDTIADYAVRIGDSIRGALNGFTGKKE